jgi:hypothetical protein
MNKTYIANENHPELIAGTEVYFNTHIDKWITKHGIETGLTGPIIYPDWYDEVKEEKKDCNCSVNVCENCNKEPTLSEDEEKEVLKQICTFCITPNGRTYEFDKYNLANYLAKLEKRIKAYKGE